MLKLIHKMVVLVTFSAALCGCTTTKIDTSKSPDTAKEAIYGIAPFKNQTASPMVGLQATAISTALLHSVGIEHFVQYSSSDDAKAVQVSGDLFSSNELTRSNLISWATSKNITYVLTGDVNEWSYKVGLDGEPAVGITLYLIDVANNKVIWSAAASRVGSSNDSLSGVGQTLILKLLHDMQRG